MSSVESAANSRGTTSCSDMIDSPSQHEKFKKVNLSGPINIIMPLDGPERIEATNDEHLTFEADTAGTTNQKDAMAALEKLDSVTSIVNASPLYAMARRNIRS